MRTRKRRPRCRPSLRFTPSAWAKLRFHRDCGPTEVGAFGIAAEDDPLLIEDVALVRQTCTAVTVKFDDASVADFFDQQIDQGRRPEQFARVWIHTHPGNSAEPSRTDERTFDRVFGHCDWAVMAILANGGARSARLRFNTGPAADVQIQTHVDWSRPFAGSDHQSWLAEYTQKVSTDVALRTEVLALSVQSNAWDERDFAAAFW